MSRLNSDNEFKELDDFFSESLRDASVKPSADVWSGIEKNLEEKRKKRYLLWFLPSLIVLIGGAIGAYFFIPESSVNNNLAETKQAVVTASSPAPVKSQNENNSSKNEAITSTEKKENNLPTDKQTKKIQIAALKNQSADLPGEISGLTVRSETGSDNIKRFFVEVPANEISLAVTNLKNAGYKDAFVMGPKQDHLVFSEPSRSTKDPAEKTNFVPPTKQNTAIAAITRSKEPKTEITSSVPSDNNTIASESKSKTGNTTNEAAKETPIENTTVYSTPENVAVSGNSEITLKKNDPVSEVAVTANSALPVNIVAVATPTETAENITKTDSVKPETKTEVVAALPKNKPDSIKPPVKTDQRFAIYLLGGPVFAQTFPDPKFAHEISPVRYNGGLKFQFMPVKKLAVELGANYQSCSSVSQENFLYFNKFDPNDVQVHSSMGDMAVSHANLMNGFSMMGPIDTLRVKYTYKINYNVINIPLIIKFYPVKKDKLAISVFVAENNQLVLSKSAELTIKKEFWDEKYRYNNIPGKSFNMSLMIGLGCEFKLSRNLHFVLEPNARYYITNPGSNPSIRSKRINFDGNAGFKLTF
jgi:hypothetical protein